MDSSVSKKLIKYQSFYDMIKYKQYALGFMIIRVLMRPSFNKTNALSLEIKAKKNFPSVKSVSGKSTTAFQVN